MGTLSSELGAHVLRQWKQPRIYADANIPAGIVGYMRQRLKWDVFFVMEHDDLRRARDQVHYEMARQLGRTLVSLDRDFLDERRFPPARSGGVIVASAPDERALARVLTKIDRVIFAPPDAVRQDASPPLAGRKIHAHLDWP